MNESGQGFPLIHVNKAFETMTGYSRCEVLGKGASFLQKHDNVNHPMHQHVRCVPNIYSEMDSVNKMKEAFKMKEDVKVCITDFKKDGSPFPNLLSLSPILDQNGELSYYFYFCSEPQIVKLSVSIIPQKVN